ncbi:MAG: hypothetical protein WCF82_22705 [Microcoleus sp.]
MKNTKTKEGRRKKEEGRRKKEEGRRNIFLSPSLAISLSPSPSEIFLYWERSDAVRRSPVAYSSMVYFSEIQ